ncbi:hypothetical protein NDU88_006832 [Pleurodeles waltl]|uniref:Uncharacterized protein n=1 Tax=Pleurodeles waltl TaxID=8319 RepID=A0AAV7N4L9_PLEWA|nr:hypothetical protein NDU88_006832 [Pleurodeles waltl]
MIQKTSGSHSIQKRETAAAVVGDIFGAMIPSLGVVLNSIKIRKLSTIVDNMLTKFSGAIILIDAELAAERAMTLQNRLALDILLAKDGGVCKMIGARHCCTYIPDNSVKIKTMLANLTKESADLKELKEPGVRSSRTRNEREDQGDCSKETIQTKKKRTMSRAKGKAVQDDEDVQNLKAQEQGHNREHEDQNKEAKVIATTAGQKEPWKGEPEPSGPGRIVPGGPVVEVGPRQG